MKEFKIYIYLRTLNGGKTLVYYVNTADEAEFIILKAKKRKSFDGYRLFMFDSYFEKYNQIAYEI